MAKPKHVAVTCLRNEVEQTMDAYMNEYDLAGICGYQVGAGFGSFVEFMMAFTLKAEILKRRVA